MKLESIINQNTLAYIPAAVPSAVAALEMAKEIRDGYEYGGSYLAPVVGIFLSILFVMVGKSVGTGFAASLSNSDWLLSGLFLLGLIGYGAGEWWVNPLPAGKVASVFVVAFYIAVPLSKIVEARAADVTMVKRAEKRAEAAEHKLAEAKLQLEVKQLQQAKRDVGKVQPNSTQFNPIQPTINPNQPESTPLGLTGSKLKVYEIYKSNPSLTQKEVAKMVGISPQAVSKHKKSLNGALAL